MNAPNSDEQDVQDMSRLAAGHDAALNELMERHAERLFHYLVRSLQNEEDASDLAQETFVKVFQNRTRFDPSQKFATWLYAIASNLVRDRYRWRSRHPQVSLDAESDTTGDSFRDSLSGGGPSPNESVQVEERAEVVRRAVAAPRSAWPKKRMRPVSSGARVSGFATSCSSPASLSSAARSRPSVTSSAR
jgi:RNA polymerase sigma-70 factor (ECF subfamily)